jgi:hypothetical protein
MPMSDDGSGIEPGNDGQTTQADRGAGYWALQILPAPFEILGLVFRAIGGLIAAIFASA